MALIEMFVTEGQVPGRIVPIRCSLGWRGVAATVRQRTTTGSHVTVNPGPVRTVGVLADDEIRDAAARGELISADFKPENVYQACYELRAGRDYFDLSGDEQQRYRLGSGVEDILIKPFQRVVVITEETLALPPDVVGRVLLKGRLFSLGLQPINTYADPGFSGYLGLVIFNSSPHYIRIERGQAIAKIEFERLPQPVTRPYNGQHGYQTEIWPMSKQMYVAAKDARRDPRVEAPGIELRRAFGEDFGAIYDRLFGYGRRLLLSAMAYVGIALLIVIYAESGGDRLPTLVAFLLGLATNVVSGVLIYLSTTLRTRRRR